MAGRGRGQRELLEPSSRFMRSWLLAAVSTWQILSCACPWERGGDKCGSEETEPQSVAPAGLKHVETLLPQPPRVGITGVGHYDTYSLKGASEK